MKLNENINLILSEEAINLKEAIELYQSAKDKYNDLRFNTIDDLKEEEEHYFDDAVKKMELLKELKSNIKEIENYTVLKKEKIYKFPPKKKLKKIW